MAQPTSPIEMTTAVEMSPESAPSGIAALGINPSLLAIQVVNFLLLLVLLRWALYRPILELLRKRRETIEQGLQKAEQAAEAAARAESQASQLLTKARSQANQIVDQARMNAETVATEVRSKASEEADALLVRTRTQLEQEKAAVMSSAERELGALVVRATERVLRTQHLELKASDVAAALAAAKDSR